MRYKAKSVAAFQLALGSLPDNRSRRVNKPENDDLMIVTLATFADAGTKCRFIFSSSGWRIRRLMTGREHGCRGTPMLCNVPSGCLTKFGQANLRWPAGRR